MKHRLFVFAALLALVSVAQAQVYDFYATSPNGQLLWYKINSDSVSVTVVSPGSYFNEDSKPAGNLIIPDTVYHGGNAYAVTNIDNECFRGCHITALHFPATYTADFDDWHFSLEISELSQITVDPANPVYDSRNNCNAIIHTATNNLLRGCATTVIPDGIETISSHAFYCCTSLTSITIPASVHSIDYRAFKYSGLSSITFQDGGIALSIGYEVFACNQNLTSIYLPAHLTAIDAGAFNECWNLANITVDSANPIYDSRDNCNAIVVSSTNVLKIGCINTTISTTVTKIACGAHIGNHNETNANIVIPSWVTGFVPSGGNWDLPYAAESIASVTFPVGWSEIDNSILRWSNWKLIFLDSIPPTLLNWGDVVPDYWYDEGSFNYSQPIIVPCGSISRWTNHPVWGAYTNISEPGTPQITVSANHGSANVVTHPTCGNDTVTISATADSNYHFVSWSDGSRQNPYTLALSGNTTLTALFAIDSATVTVTSADAGKGSVMGGGVIPLGGTATVTAVPTGNNIFLSWSNGVTANPYTFTVTSDTTLTAQFTLPDTIVLHDTTYVPVHDTTYVDVHDTTYVPVHDTTYIYVHDTTYVPVYAVEYVDNFIHDTTFVNTYVHDTTIQYVNQYVHDTTLVNIYVHDTTIQYVNQYVHDTTYINNNIHDTLVQYVNQYVHDTLYINNYVHDTVLMNTQMYDTMIVNNYQFDTTLYSTYHFDTVIVNNNYYDTVFVHLHDTIYITEGGMDGANGMSAKVYSSRGQIVVEGAADNQVWLYDVAGREITHSSGLTATSPNLGEELNSRVVFDVPASGTYLIKIGTYPARRVVVK